MAGDILILQQPAPVSLDADPGRAQQRALEHAQRRGQILAFEALLAQHPQAVFGDSDTFPLMHHFTPGVYLREIFLPQGALVVGKIHKQEHLVVLLSGALRLYTEAGGLHDVHAPAVLTSPPGAKRAALILEDARWCTVHPNPTDTQDLAALEDEIIAPTYLAYSAWKALTAGEASRPALEE